MLFRSTVKHPLRFTMDGKVFEVAPEGDCEIPDAKAFAVKGMGLPMVVAPPPAPVAPAPAPTPAPRKPGKPAPLTE